jgi:hypothetical protein
MKIHNDLRDVSEGTLDFPSDQNDVSEAILQIHSDQSDVLMVTREISPCQNDVTLDTSKIDNGHPDVFLVFGKIPSAFREMNPVGGKSHRLFRDVETGVENSPAIKAAEGRRISGRFAKSGTPLCRVSVLDCASPLALGGDAKDLVICETGAAPEVRA